jgi:hypothetical protein
MGAQGTASLDFGAFPGGSDATVAVTGQVAILAGSLVEAWILPAATADHSADEHVMESLKVFAGNIVAGTGFTIYGANTSQLNEPLEMPGVSQFRSAATTVYGYVAPTIGGKGTRLYGVWNIGWVWN